MMSSSPNPNHGDEKEKKEKKGDKKKEVKKNQGKKRKWQGQGGDLPADLLGRTLMQPPHTMDLVFSFLSVFDGLSCCVSRGHNNSNTYWRCRSQFNKRFHRARDRARDRARQAQQQAQRASQRRQQQAQFGVFGDAANNPICL
jgi:hypothetical protein